MRSDRIGFGGFIVCLINWMIDGLVDWLPLKQTMNGGREGEGGIMVG